MLPCLRSFRPGVLTFAAVLAFLSGGATFARTQSDVEVRQAIIQESVADYLATGHPCACPYNAARNGSSCGARSAYSRPGGAAPLCYPKDVSDAMVADWKKAHGGQ